MAGTAISFDGNNLQTYNGEHGIIVDDIPHIGATGKKATPYVIAHANRTAIPFIEYPSKTFNLTGQIVGSTIADLDALIDTFNSYLLSQDANLDIGYGTGTRRYIATMGPVAFVRPNGLIAASFTLPVICTSPFGMNTSSTTAVTATGRTSANYDDTYTFLGTAPYQAPIITVTLTALTGGTAKPISISNNNSGETITVTRDWTAADVLQIDSANSVVTVNGTEVDFTGAFPVFIPGSGSIGYSDSLTTRTFNYDVSYTVRYQ